MRSSVEFRGGSTGVIENISDTARWVAVYRARETERPDPVFRDPFARRLAGARGEEIARAHTYTEANDWPFVARTYMFDAVIAGEVERGVDTVVCLASGLDARPYRMELPESLRWIEIDLPEIIEYKQSVLAGEKPRCVLERVAQDLADEAGRRTLFDRIARKTRRALVISEGLLVYLTDDQVVSLAHDLTARRPFERWAADLANPGVLGLMQRVMSEHVDQAGIPFRFGPAEGPAFFQRAGWKTVEIRSSFRTAANLNRLPPELRTYAQFPDAPEPWRLPMPWSGVCLFERI
ncbi:MAG TPA: SAM-dependent methyltransferase [Vicinamibacterales bacterium]|nr:SAM-dependent methyltransferase [Vicinamibacterales bacterium]